VLLMVVVLLLPELQKGWMQPLGHTLQLQGLEWWVPPRVELAPEWLHAAGQGALHQPLGLLHLGPALVQHWRHLLMHPLLVGLLLRHGAQLLLALLLLPLLLLLLQAARVLPSVLMLMLALKVMHPSVKPQFAQLPELPGLRAAAQGGPAVVPWQAHQQGRKQPLLLLLLLRLLVHHLLWLW
jgi:hypothetical protein